ncbi:hypothetical protein ECA1672 [Pectobacterium atrosepticum SCRI1043]|uniref:Uncharacterized protein n=1 Tax=Pectobacterium atrosepticum (strain SCRI 1043 / ATCC BAA-672) TaxID=218491 RepID=Q6D6K9_PECAS|nr:hypothetical protein ECA1672 [Pectobacterium atrosepticum SCRI1043]
MMLLNHWSIKISIHIATIRKNTKTSPTGFMTPLCTDESFSNIDTFRPISDFFYQKRIIVFLC